MSKNRIIVFDNRTSLGMLKFCSNNIPGDLTYMNNKEEMDLFFEEMADIKNVENPPILKLKERLGKVVDLFMSYEEDVANEMGEYDIELYEDIENKETLDMFNTVYVFNNTNVVIDIKFRGYIKSNYNAAVGDRELKEECYTYRATLLPGTKMCLNIESCVLSYVYDARRSIDRRDTVLHHSIEYCI